jgi:undecaprenyl diphosphate synthase
MSAASEPSAESRASAPRHVGIIMDGNGRWAQSRGLPRFEGHRRGVEAVRRAVRAAEEFGVRYLTIYSFSTENWSRPPDEVAVLMGLLKRFIRNDLAELHGNDVRVRVIGAREGLANDIRVMLTEAEELTQHNRGLTLVVAFNYGGPRGGDRVAFSGIDRRGDVRGQSRNRRHSRPRSHHPDVGRTAAL